MSPLKRSDNFAARMGRWSARHRKIAVFGWLAFVVAAVVIGGGFILYFVHNRRKVRIPELTDR